MAVVARSRIRERREPRARLGRLSGPPLIVRFIGLVVGALIAAQLVTLLLTLVLPPAPPRDYALADIAGALRGAADDADRFDRVEQAGPPDFSSRGWFVSQTSRGKLAGLLGLPVDKVALGFYTQLPVGGSVDAVAAPQRLPVDAERLRQRVIGAIGLVDPRLQLQDTGGTVSRLLHAALLQQMPGGPPGGGFPGGGPPGGGFPGGGLPGGGFPQSLPQPPRQLPPATPPPPVATRAPPAQAQPSPGPVSPSGPASGSPPGIAPPAAGAPPPADGLPATPFMAVPIMPPASPAFVPPERPVSAPRPDDTPRGRSSSAETPAVSRLTVAAPASAAASPMPTSPVTTAPSGVAAPPLGDAAPQLGRPLPIARPATGLFGLAPSPFVEGDFVAGMRLADGRWIVVSPRAEGFPSAWQRRVALWFLLSLLAVAPVAWLFARRIVGPLNDFAEAADLLGRDPGAAVLPLDGPAEIGRAAHAFNQMQNRLRSFVDDRTAMIGAISHDLRTPLTRLRFRIEDVPEEQQDALRDEVAEMEAMISSVIAFMRDASTPHARERRDLAEIVDDVIEDAALLGEVKAGWVESAMVDVDPLGIRRVLDNLLTNAIKYGGGRARVALRIEESCAVADVVDDGPGVPDGELDRIFEPFYRSEAARASGREGSGLGLAVCRSIARAHGGDVALFRSADGFTARVTLPLAFGDDRRAA